MRLQHNFASLLRNHAWNPNPTLHVRYRHNPRLYHEHNGLFDDELPAQKDPSLSRDVFVLAYLSSQHIYRMWVNFGGFNLDITTFTMLLICKLSALAFCYKDGAEKDEDLTDEQK